MDVPETVTDALADRPVAGAVCLEAGAGVGNTTAGLLARDAERVYAVTSDRDHARTVRERVAGGAVERVGSGSAEPAAGEAAGGVASGTPDRTAVLEADLRAVPLPDGAVDVVTAHGLFNVLAPADVPAVAAELTRVAAPGAHLVVDDYEPPPGDAAVRDLFAVENAAAALAEGTRGLTFYPAELLRRVFAGYGWAFDRERTLLDPVPWTGSHVEAHADVARSAAGTLPEELGEPLAAEADRLAAAIGGESVGRMYSVAMRLPGRAHGARRPAQMNSSRSRGSGRPSRYRSR